MIDEVSSHQVGRNGMYERHDTYAMINASIEVACRPLGFWVGRSRTQLGVKCTGCAAAVPAKTLYKETLYKIESAKIGTYKGVISQRRGSM